MDGLKNAIGLVMSFGFSGYSFNNLPDVFNVIIGAASALLGLALTASLIWYNYEKIKFQREQTKALRLKIEDHSIE